jgi:Ser/Thr protein kinase RdoA (MazF antagonist)
VRDLPGYVLEGRAERGESGDGAWFATDSSGRRVVIKWFDDLSARQRFEVTADALDELRARGCPVPSYVSIEVLDGVLVLAQSRLDGETDVPVTERTVADVLELNARQVGVMGQRAQQGSWGEFLIESLVIGEDGWCMHESMHAHSDRTRRIVELAESIGADADPSWFRETGIMHLDLHPGNLLFAHDGAVTGVVDWEGATVGDPLFDLTSFAFCGEVGADTPAAIVAPVWRVLEESVEPRVLRAYAAHQALRLVDWMLRHHTEDDVQRWLAASEAMLARYA